jgi:hypothetical protein
MPCRIRYILIRNVVLQTMLKHPQAFMMLYYRSTRWFKYDRDWFVCKQAALRSSCATLLIIVTKKKSVPVIFEPPCINKRFLSNHQESSEKCTQFVANWRWNIACIRGKTSSVPCVRDPVLEIKVATLHEGETFPFTAFVLLRAAKSLPETMWKQ